MPSRDSSALRQLVISRIRLFLREPAAVFWVYGFPVLMLILLGAAFRDDPREEITVDVIDSPGAGAITDRLKSDPRFQVRSTADEAWRKRLQYGKTDLVIAVDADGHPEFWQEPRRAESRIARYAVQAALSEKSAETTPEIQVRRLDETGSRYIDFLLPGMIGMGLMGGGLWGVGFVVVDMRVRKLLKRFLATPMRRSDFLMSIMIGRILFTLVDVVFLLIVGDLMYGVACRGSYWSLLTVVSIGSVTFAGIGLLVSSRARTLETVSGLMNLIMLPMWLLSGVFFSSERFPEAMQPIVNALPLTALNQSLRAVMLEGEPLRAVWPQLCMLTVYGVLSFAIALRIFRWK